MAAVISVSAITGMFESLSEEDQISALDYIQYLRDRAGRRKAEQARRAFEEVDRLLNGDTGWASEEEMIADLAQFRRERESARAKT